MKKLFSIVIMVGLLGNAIAAEGNHEKSSKGTTKVIAAFLLGVGAGIIGFKYYTSLFMNNILQEKIALGKGVAEEIERLDNNPVEYMAQCLADGHIGTLETNDEESSAIRVKQFYLERKHPYGKAYSLEELKSARDLLEKLEINFDAYNAYAEATGRIPLVIKKEHDFVDNQKLLQCIGIKKSIKRTDDWIK